MPSTMHDTLDLGGHMLRNRLVATAHGLAAVDDGIPNDADAAYWSRISHAGPAMVITGGVQVTAAATLRQRYLGEAWHPWSARGFRKRADAIASGGALAVVQLGHLGRETLGASTFFPFEAPSAVRGPREPVAARVLPTDEVADVVRAFGVSAANMVDAGYRGIEIHAAHGYLLAQFLSGLVNDRTDRYGGNVAGRATILVETVDEIRRRAPGALLGVRFSVENDAGGLTIDDLAAVAELLAEQAPVDYVNISFGNRGYYVRDMATGGPPLGDHVAELAAAVGAPLLASSAFRTNAQVAAALADGAALVGMARPFLADPDVAAKLLAGHEDDIRPCVSCNEDCRAFEPTATCTVNPGLGPAGERRKPAAPVVLGVRPRAATTRVAVVGAGPAGLECATTIGSSGRTDVHLFEREEHLGGQLRIAAAASGRRSWQLLLDFYERQLRRHGVRTSLGTDPVATTGLEAYDVVVWALGAQEARPAGHLASRTNVTDFLLGPSAPRNPVVIDDGFGWWPTVNAVETAFDRGAASVTVVSRGRGFAGSIPAESRLQLMERLRERAFRVLPHADVELRDEERVGIRFNGSALTEEVAADLVIEVAERIARPAHQTAQPSLAIGDCVMPRRVSHAVAEGRAAAEWVLSGQWPDRSAHPAIFPRSVVAVTPDGT